MSSSTFLQLLCGFYKIEHKLDLFGIKSNVTINRIL